MPAARNDRFSHYRAKTGHDARFGKAMLSARIRDLNTETELGQTEDSKEPITVMSPRADKRDMLDTHANTVDMNRAYKRRFNSMTHYNDIDRESVLTDIPKTESSFKLKRHLKRAAQEKSSKSEDFETALPFLDDTAEKEAIMNLNDRLMENRADATMHRGRDPTDDQDYSNTIMDLEAERDTHMQLAHLKSEKQKMYFKQMGRVWEAMRRKGKKKDTLFPEGAPEDENAQASKPGVEGEEGVKSDGLQHIQA
jgi:hypothetical protein